MRLFIGIYPDANLLRYCRDVYRHFDEEKRNLKEIPLEQIHLTVRFVGARVSDNSKNELLAALREVHDLLPRPTIKLKRLQFGFSRQHDPRVLFADVEPTPELIELQDKINFVIKKLDFQDTVTFKSHKEKTFHISIARLKPAATRSTGRKVRELLSTLNLPFPEPFVADRIDAIQSIINDRQKPVYRNLESIKL
jgi:2'-5' RNA ligase